MIAYIKQQGSVVGREGRTLVVRKEDFKQTIFTHRLKQLVLMGGVMLTAPAVNLLCREGIDTVFLTRNGNFKGRLEGLEQKNVFLHRRQFESLNQPTFVLECARSFVLGKLHNMITFIARLKRRYKQRSPELMVGVVQNIRRLAEQARKCEDLNELRGYEGRGTRLFFEGYRNGFSGQLNFVKRVRRPPTDPVNSVLSLLYTMLFNRVHAALRLAGLDPRIGYLHSLDYGRYSLALDLMEEFRSLVVETGTLSLFNLKILDEHDFFFEEAFQPAPDDPTCPGINDDPLGGFYENPDDGFFTAPEQRVEEQPGADHEPQGKRPCRLKPDSLKRVLESFEDKVKAEFIHPATGRRLSYDDAMKFQARHLRAVLEGEQARYMPLQLK